MKPLLARFSPGEARVRTRSLTWEQKVAYAIEVLGECEQLEMPVTHDFQEGLYIRTIFMPADTYVIGHIHRTRHINRVLTGRALVTMHGETRNIAAPSEFYSDAGVQKVLYIVEDMLWQTVHDNPGNSRNVPALEESLVVLDKQTLARKGALQLDELRMLKTRQLKSLQ